MKTTELLVEREPGQVTAYALDSLGERGEFFVPAGTQVYGGQIVGENCRDNDMEINIVRAKKMTNIRAASADKTVVLRPPRDMPMEMALEFIEEDELVEITPDAIRMRKRLLQEIDRRRQSRKRG